jgi:hypothetical protein
LETIDPGSGTKIKALKKAVDLDTKSGSINYRESIIFNYILLKVKYFPIYVNI